jgi:hypothetical protein
MCEELVWPPVFSCGLTEAVCLYDLGNVIAAITAEDMLYHQVSRLAVVGPISADTGGCGASMDGGSSIFDRGAEYHHARGPEEAPPLTCFPCRRPRKSLTH